jgi:hypothetical protein
MNEDGKLNAQGGDELAPELITRVVNLLAEAKELTPEEAVGRIVADLSTKGIEGQQLSDLERLVRKWLADGPPPAP